VHGYDALRQGEVSPRCLALIGVGEGAPFEINLIFAEKAECRRWFRGLKDLINYHLEQERLNPTIKAAVDLFVQSDLDGNGSLDMKEATRAFAGVGISKADFLKLRTEVDADDDAQLDFSEFVTLMSRVRVKDRTDQNLQRLREEAEGPAGEDEEVGGVPKAQSLGVDAIAKVLEKLTQEEGTEEELAARARDVVLDKYSVLASVGRIDFEGMRRYLGSRDNSVNKRKNASFTWEDYDFDGDNASQPITRYLVDTSHNTFLEGDQLIGEASVKAYVMALARGCKCVEADCWNGELDKYDQPHPIITRGGSLTSYILFEDMCEALAQEAFSTDEHDDVSAYPLIISLEVHTSIGPQSDALARALEKHLGDRLARPVNFAKGASLPTLSELKGKVILLGEVGKSIPATSALGKLIYLHAKEVPSNEAEWKAAIQWPPHWCLNLSEPKLSGMSEAGRTSLKAFNDRHFTRVFPFGLRYDSSNMSPWKGWECGCQLVALNLQRADRHLRFNLATFPDVVGYRLKSVNFCGPDTVKLYKDKAMNVKTNHKLIVRVEVVYGTDLLRGTDPYVTVSCASSSKDFQRAQTAPVYGNSKNPYWGEVFQFDIDDGRSAAVELGVWDRKTGKLTSYGAFHVADAKNGLRSLTLHDIKSGMPLRRTHLMCLIKIATPR